LKVLRNLIQIHYQNVKTQWSQYSTSKE